MRSQTEGTENISCGISLSGLIDTVLKGGLVVGFIALLNMVLLFSTSEELESGLLYR